MTATTRALNWIAMIYGILVTALMLLAFGSKLAGIIIEQGLAGAAQIARSAVDWYDDPTGFFLSYLVGYVLIWWKPLWGSSLILMASIIVGAINSDNEGFVITALITGLVGILYLIGYLLKIKVE